MRYLVLLLLAGLAASPREVTILTVSPPELVTVEPANWKIAGRAPLPAVPAAVTIPPGHEFLYVLVDGATNADGSLPKGPGKVVVFRLSDRKIVAALDVGWGASRIALTQDERYVACFRDHPPARVFERPPSVAVGSISLISQARKAHRPSRISLIDIHDHRLVWQKELDPGDQNVTFSAEAEIFCVPNSKGGLRLADLHGRFRTVDLPAGRGKRRTALSPDGRWAYVLEDGRDSTEKAERVNGRIFVISTNDATVAGTTEVEHERLTAFDGANDGGVLVANESGFVRQFVGPGIRWAFPAGRDFRFTRRLDEPRGLLVAGKKQLSFFDSDAASGPSWTLQTDFHGNPDDDIVPVSNKGVIAVPVMNTNHGLDLDRVALVDLQKREASEGIAVGRRGRMAAKALGLAAAEGASNGIAGPNTFTWNGFVLDVSRTMAKLFECLVAGNPLLKAGRDGSFLYAMSRFGNDVTIIRTADSTVIQKLPTGGNSQGLLAANGGPVCAWAGKQLIWIDTETNTVRSKQRPCHGGFDRAQIGPEGKWIVTFGSRCAMFWHSRTGDLAGAVENLGRPRLVIE